MIRRIAATWLERAARELTRLAARVHPMPLPKEERDQPWPTGIPPVTVGVDGQRMVQEGAPKMQTGLHPEEPKKGPLKGSAAWRAQQGDR